MARILYAEDDLVSAKLVSRMLEGMGHEVVHTADGAGAVEHLAAGAFDLLVTDLVMKNLSGHELVRIVRGDPATRHLPILMTTGRDDVERFEWVRDLDVEVIPKPLKLEFLMERVALHCGNDRTAHV